MVKAHFKLYKKATLLYPSYLYVISKFFYNFSKRTVSDVFPAISATKVMIILKLWTVIVTLSIILIIRATLAQNLGAPLCQQAEQLSGKIYLTPTLSEGICEHFTTNKFLKRSDFRP